MNGLFNLNQLGVKILTSELHVQLKLILKSLNWQVKLANGFLFAKKFHLWYFKKITISSGCVGHNRGTLQTVE